MTTPNWLYMVLLGIVATLAAQGISVLVRRWWSTRNSQKPPREWRRKFWIEFGASNGSPTKPPEEPPPEPQKARREPLELEAKQELEVRPLPAQPEPEAQQLEEVQNR